MLSKKLLMTLLLIFALALVACGGDTTTDTTPVATEETEVEEPTEEMEEPTEEVAEEPTEEVMEEPTEEVMEDTPEPVEEPTDAPTEEPTEVPTEEAAGEPDLTGETITFYHFGDLSGPLAGITAPLVHGFEDAIAAINDTGGIYGAQIALEFRDTGGSVDEAVASYDAFTSGDEEPIVMFTYGSGDGEALATRFAEDGIVNLAAGLSGVAFYGEGSGYTFGYAPIYPDQFGLFLEWLQANWEDHKPATAGDDINVAYISWPTAYGQGALTAETRAFAEELGINIVAEEVIDVSPTADTSTAILNAQAAGANVIWTNTLAFGPAGILNDLNSLGLRQDFVVGSNNWAMDLATYAFLADPAYAVGLISPFPYLWWTDADNPGIQYAEQLFADNERGPGEHAVGYLLTAAGVDIAVTAIKQAILEVGFENLDGTAVHDALEALGPYEPLQGVMHVDFSDGNRSPHEAQIRQIQGGPDAFVVLQDWTPTPDLRPAQ